MSEFADFEVEVDFNGIEAWDGEYTLVPPGDYKVTVSDLEQTTGNGKAMIAAVFEISEGDHVGSKIFNNYMLGNATGLARLKSLMVACGASLDKFRASECLGASIMLTVVHNEGKAQPQPDGTVKAARTFANVQGERQLEEAPAAPVPTPPVTRGRAQAAKPPAVNGTAPAPAGSRRA